MAIVGVRGARAPIRQQVAKEEADVDPLDLVLKGLNVAQSVFGIKSAFEQNRLTTLKADRAERVAEGKFLPSELSAQGFTKPGEGDDDLPTQTFKVKTAEGVFEDQSFISSESRKLSSQQRDTLAKTTAKSDERRQDLTFKLKKEFRKESADTLDAIRGFEKVKSQAAVKNPNGASDMALLFGFMKSIDPGSVVRESEFRTANETTPITEKFSLGRLRDKVLSGVLLTPNQRLRILEASKRGVASQLGLQNDFINSSFRQDALQLGLDPSTIVNPQFEELRRALAKELGIGNDKRISSDSLPFEDEASAGSDEDFLGNFLIKNQQNQSRAPSFGGGL